MNRSIISLALILVISSFQNTFAQFDKETLAKATELLAQKKELKKLEKQLFSQKKEITAEEYLQHTTEFKLREYDEFRAYTKKQAIITTALAALGTVASCVIRNEYPNIAILSAFGTGVASVFAFATGIFLILNPDSTIEKNKEMILKRGINCEITRSKKYIEYCKEKIARKS